MFLVSDLKGSLVCLSIGNLTLTGVTMRSGNDMRQMVVADRAMCHKKSPASNYGGWAFATQ